MGQELGHENRITIQKAKSSLEIRALRYYYYNDSLKYNSTQRRFKLASECSVRI